MSTSVTMPALGESVSEGTVTRWLKQEGDEVNADEPLLEVSTDKVDTEIPSPASGVLQKIVVAEDETVSVGAELAVIGDGAGGGGDGQTQDKADESQQEQSADDQGSQDEGGDESSDDGGDDQAQDTADDSQQDQDSQDSQDQGEQQDQGGQQGGGQQGGAQPGGGGGTTVTMPALGESVTEGTVTRWLKKEGDQVETDEPLLEVSTDKVDTEIPSPASGVLQQIMVAEDETVEVGAGLAVIGGSGGGGGGEQAAPNQDEQKQDEQKQEQQEQPEQKPAEKSDQKSEQKSEQAAPAKQEAKESAPAPQQSQQQAPPQQQKAPNGESTDGAAYVTPLVRKLAAEHGVDLARLKGTGVGGRIRKQDVLEAGKAQQAEQQAPQQKPAAASGAPAPDMTGKRGTTEKMSRLRKVIATRMVESLQVSAQLTTVVEVDLTRIARLRARAKGEFEAREGVKLSYLPFLAKATVEALKAHPKLNSSIDTEKGEITYFDTENLGVAVDTERGLLVPVVKEAGDLNIAGLARRIADLAERTRSNKIGPDELGGGTFTLTNTGSRGALFDTPIINQPQVGILGTGAVVKRPVVVDGPDVGETIAIRSMCYLALSYDHRVVDGADAARFLVTIKSRLEEGSFEADLGL